MRTFCEFVEQRDKLSNILESIVVEAQNNPEFNELLTKEGFWDTMKNVGTGIKNFAQGVWSGGGIKPGAQAAWSAVTGPAAQVQAAMGALQKTLAQIQRDPQWSQSRTTGSGGLPAMPLVNWLQGTIEELKSQQQQFQNKTIQPGQSAITTPAMNAPGTAYDPTGTKHI